MTKSQAEEMLRGAFGPGDLGAEIDLISDELFDHIEMGDRLIEWMSEQLADEEEIV